MNLQFSIYRLLLVLVLLSNMIAACTPSTTPTADYTAIETENIQVVRNWITAFNTKDYDAIDNLWTADAVDHAAFPDAPAGPEGEKIAVQFYASVFPDVEFDVHEIIAKDDIVAVRYMMHGTHSGEFQGISPSGKEVGAQGMNFFRLENGKIAENWLTFDFAGLVAQMQEVAGQ